MRAFFRAIYSARLLVVFPTNSLYSAIFSPSLEKTAPMPDRPGFPLLAPSILIVNKFLIANSMDFTL